MISDGDVEFAVIAKPENTAVVIRCTIASRNYSQESGVNAGAGRVTVPFDYAKAILGTYVKQVDKRCVGVGRMQRDAQQPLRALRFNRHRYEGFGLKGCRQ
jgi:hypothetical protein